MQLIASSNEFTSSKIVGSSGVSGRYSSHSGPRSAFTLSLSAPSLTALGLLPSPGRVPALLWPALKRNASVRSLDKVDSIPLKTRLQTEILVDENELLLVSRRQ